MARRGANANDHRAGLQHAPDQAEPSLSWPCGDIGGRRPRGIDDVALLVALDLSGLQVMRGNRVQLAKVNSAFGGQFHLAGWIGIWPERLAHSQSVPARVNAPARLGRECNRPCCAVLGEPAEGHRGGGRIAPIGDPVNQLAGFWASYSFMLPTIVILRPQTHRWIEVHIVSIDDGDQSARRFVGRIRLPFALGYFVLSCGRRKRSLGVAIALVRFCICLLSSLIWLFRGLFTLVGRLFARLISRLFSLLGLLCIWLLRPLFGGFRLLRRLLAINGLFVRLLRVFS